MRSELIGIIEDILEILDKMDQAATQDDGSFSTRELPENERVEGGPQFLTNAQAEVLDLYREELLPKMEGLGGAIESAERTELQTISLYFRGADIMEAADNPDISKVTAGAAVLYGAGTDGDGPGFIRSEMESLKTRTFSFRDQDVSLHDTIGSFREGIEGFKETVESIGNGDGMVDSAKIESTFGRMGRDAAGTLMRTFRSSMDISSPTVLDTLKESGMIGYGSRADRETGENPRINDLFHLSRNGEDRSVRGEIVDRFGITLDGRAIPQFLSRQVGGNGAQNGQLSAHGRGVLASTISNYVDYLADRGLGSYPTMDRIDRDHDIKALQHVLSGIHGRECASVVYDSSITSGPGVYIPADKQYRISMDEKTALERYSAAVCELYGVSREEVDVDRLRVSLFEGASSDRITRDEGTDTGTTRERPDNDRFSSSNIEPTSRQQDLNNYIKEKGPAFSQALTRNRLTLIDNIQVFNTMVYARTHGLAIEGKHGERHIPTTYEIVNSLNAVLHTNLIEALFIGVLSAVLDSGLEKDKQNDVDGNGVSRDRNEDPVFPGGDIDEDPTPPGGGVDEDRDGADHPQDTENQGTDAPDREQISEEGTDRADNPETDSPEDAADDDTANNPDGQEDQADSARTDRADTPDDPEAQAEAADTQRRQEETGRADQDENTEHDSTDRREGHEQRDAVSSGNTERPENPERLESDIQSPSSMVERDDSGRSTQGNPGASGKVDVSGVPESWKTVARLDPKWYNTMVQRTTELRDLLVSQGYSPEQIETDSARYGFDLSVIGTEVVIPEERADGAEDRVETHDTDQDYMDAMEERGTYDEEDAADPEDSEPDPGYLEEQAAMEAEAFGMDEDAAPSDAADTETQENESADHVDEPEEDADRVEDREEEPEREDVEPDTEDTTERKREEDVDAETAEALSVQSREDVSQENEEPGIDPVDTPEGEGQPQGMEAGFSESDSDVETQENASDPDSNVQSEENTQDTDTQGIDDHIETDQEPADTNRIDVPAQTEEGADSISGDNLDEDSQAGIPEHEPEAEEDMESSTPQDTEAETGSDEPSIQDTETEADNPVSSDTETQHDDTVDRDTGENVSQDSEDGNVQPDVETTDAENVDLTSGEDEETGVDASESSGDDVPGIGIEENDTSSEIPSPEGGSDPGGEEAQLSGNGTGEYFPEDQDSADRPESGSDTDTQPAVIEPSAEGSFVEAAILDPVTEMGNIIQACLDGEGGSGDIIRFITENDMSGEDIAHAFSSAIEENEGLSDQSPMEYFDNMSTLTDLVGTVSETMPDLPVMISADLEGSDVQGVDTSFNAMLDNMMAEESFFSDLPGEDMPSDLAAAEMVEANGISEEVIGGFTMDANATMQDMDTGMEMGIDQTGLEAGVDPAVITEGLDGMNGADIGMDSGMDPGMDAMAAIANAQETANTGVETPQTDMPDPGMDLGAQAAADDIANQIQQDMMDQATRDLADAPVETTTEEYTLNPDGSITQEDGVDQVPDEYTDEPASDVDAGDTDIG